MTTFQRSEKATKTLMDCIQSAADLRRDAERRRREMIDQLRASRSSGHDGWCEKLSIYLPKPTVLDLTILPEEMQPPKESKFFRDPVTKQWISKVQIQRGLDALKGQ